jgi:hypothetical protein
LIASNANAQAACAKMARRTGSTSLADLDQLAAEILAHNREWKAGLTMLLEDAQERLDHHDGDPRIPAARQTPRPQ